MADLIQKKRIGQYDARNIQSGDQVFGYDPDAAEGSRTFRGNILVGDAAGIADGTSTEPKMYTDAELKSAINGGAIPVGTTDEIKTSTDTTPKIYSPKAVGDAIDQTVDEYVTAILADDAEVAAGTAGLLPDSSQVIQNYSVVKKSIVALQALTGMTDGQVAYLSLGGRSGEFIWTLGDFSTQVTADTRQGVYIASSTVAATVGVWKRKLNGYVTPEMFGFVSGDAKPIIEYFRDSDFSELRVSNSFSLSSQVSFDMASVTCDKRILLMDDVVITHSASGAGIKVTASTKESLLPFFYLVGGKQALFDDDDIGVTIQDVRNARIYNHFPYGDITLATSRGTGFKLINVDAYTERTMLIDCGAPNCKHDIWFHTVGGEDGGLSFARTIVSNFFINGGVSGQPKIKISSEIEATLNVGAGNANSYTIGETVTQSGSGASGVVRGWPEARDVIYVVSILGTFDTSNPVVGSLSGASFIPSSIILDRLPTVYDSTIEGIRGNIQSGAIVMQIGGGMVGTKIRDLQVESSGTAYYFEDLDNWTFQRPIIDFPDVANNMSLYFGTPAGFSSKAAKLGTALLEPMAVAPETTDGVIAVADGAGWNPQAVSGNGGKGLFVRLFSKWKRIPEFTQTNDAALSSITNPINTSEKWFGKPVFSSTTNTYYFAIGASAGSAWKPYHDNTGGSNITPS